MQETSKQFQGMQSMRIDSIIWSQSSESPSPQTVNHSTYLKTIQKPFLSHIKPDYGSLGQFMKDVGISKDILLHNRKKKQDLQEDMEQKKMKNALRQQNLEEILMKKDATLLEKTTASKLIVENIFQQKFGVTVGEFCSQNSRMDYGKATFASIPQLSQMMQSFISESKQKNGNQHYQSKHELPFLRKSKGQLQSQEMLAVSQNHKMSTILRLQQNYPTLKKHVVQKDFLSDLEQTKKFVRINKHSTHSFTLQAVQQLTFLKVVQLLKATQLQNLSAIKIKNTSVSQQVLLFILDYFLSFSLPCLRELTLQGIKLTKLDRVCNKVRQFVESTRIKTLSMSNMGLGSRQFCMLCLGIGSRNSFDLCLFRDNQICQLSLKCLLVLIKFRPQTKFDFSNNPIDRLLVLHPTVKRALVSKWHEK